MYILYQMHVAWFETEMALETIQSVKQAIQNTNLEVKIKLCFNKQTKFDTPVDKNIDDMFSELLKDELVKQAEITCKTDADEFYNVGDWRRECYDAENITIWGESDCLVPHTYFAYIESIFDSIREYPFIVTIKQKKMWDASWTPTEHEALQPFTLEQVRAINSCFVTGEGLLTYKQLNAFNDSFHNNHGVVRTDLYKGDGALICISPNMPTPFIDNRIKVFGEDTYFFNYCRANKIPVYTITNYIKGHNTGHPLKKVNHYRTDKQMTEFNEFQIKMQQLTTSCINNLY